MTDRRSSFERMPATSKASSTRARPGRRSPHEAITCSASYAICPPAMRARAAATSTDGMHARAISPCTRSTGASCSAVVLRTDAGRAGERVGTGEGKCGGNRPPAAPRYFQSTTKNAERHGGSVWLESLAERSILRHGTQRDLHMIAHCGLHPPEDFSLE